MNTQRKWVEPRFWHRSLLVLMLVLMLLLSACTSQQLVGGRAHSINRGGPNFTQDDATNLQGLYSLYYDAYSESHYDPGDKAKAGELLKSGHNFMYGACVDFFKLLGITQQRQNIRKDQVSFGSNAITGIMAATDTRPKVITGFSILSEMALAAFNINQVHVLFNPDTNAIEELVLRAMALHREEDQRRLASKSDYDFYDADTALQDFDRACTVQRIRALVDEAIATGNVAPISEPSLSLADALVQPRDSAVVSELANKLGENFLTPPDVVALYWLFVVGANASEQEMACKEVSDFRTNKPCTTSTPSQLDRNFGSDLTAELRSALMGLDPNVKTLINAQINENVKALEKAAQAHIEQEDKLAEQSAASAVEGFIDNKQREIDAIINPVRFRLQQYSSSGSLSRNEVLVAYEGYLEWDSKDQLQQEEICNSLQNLDLPSCSEVIEGWTSRLDSDQQFAVRNILRGLDIGRARSLQSEAAFASRSSTNLANTVRQGFSRTPPPVPLLRIYNELSTGGSSRVEIRVDNSGD